MDRRIGRDFHQLLLQDVIVLCSACVCLVWTCHEVGVLEEPSIVEKVYYSDVILYGKVLKTYEDKLFDYGAGSQVYTAEMKIYCSFKGDRVPGVVNITEAGAVPGHCAATTLKVGQEYIVLLRKRQNKLRPAETELQAIPEIMLNVTQACGLTLQYPYGIEASNPPIYCPRVATAGNCIQFVPPQPKPPATPRYSGMRTKNAPDAAEVLTTTKTIKTGGREKVKATQSTENYSSTTRGRILTPAIPGYPGIKTKSATDTAEVFTTAKKMETGGKEKVKARQSTENESSTTRGHSLTVFLCLMSMFSIFLP